MHTQARLLERLLFAIRFEHADPASVGRLISAYQNSDGGLGYALEPDLRCPESQPLFVEVGLSALHDAGWRDEQLSLSICSFLESVSNSEGLVPTILPSALASPILHWSSAGFRFEPHGRYLRTAAFPGHPAPGWSVPRRWLLLRPPRSPHSGLSPYLVEYHRSTDAGGIAKQIA
jgi:hypothetical protein